MLDIFPYTKLLGYTYFVTETKLFQSIVTSFKQTGVTNQLSHNFEYAHHRGYQIR